MKVIRKILYVIAFLSALLCVLVVVCAVRPDVTEKIRGLLYRNHNTRAGTETIIKEPDAPGIKEPVYLSNDIGNGADIGTDDGGLKDDEAAEDIVQSKAGDAIDVEEADYIAPEESEIVIPDSVSGRSGYRQIQGNEEQVDDSAAVDIRATLDTGYTGDGLDFDALFYPFYAMLDDRGKHVYRQVYANANELYPTFMPVEEVTAKQLKNIFEAVYNDHPELFWIETAYTCKYMRSGQCVEIDLEFNETAQDLDSAKADFDRQAGEIVVAAQNLPDAYSKEKFVHDALLDKITYNSHARMNQSAYSALVGAETVCAGYARAFQYVLQQLGIPCYYCTGYAGESHAWNIVSLDDGFYNVDTTWDDSGGGKYDYFNKTDGDYASNHIRQDMSVYLPSCNGQAYRNLERSQENAGLRSLEDAGFAQEQVLTDIDRYYEDCYSQIVQTGKGHYIFYNVIEGEQLLEEWDRSYRTQHYKKAYMENAMAMLEAYHCEMVIEVEALQDGRYLVMHEVTLSE